MHHNYWPMNLISKHRVQTDWIQPTSSNCTPNHENSGWTAIVSSQGAVEDIDCIQSNRLDTTYIFKLHPDHEISGWTTIVLIEIYLHLFYTNHQDVPK